MATQKRLSSTLPHMIIVLVIVAALSAFILGTVSKMTAGPIQTAKDKRELEAISQVVYGEFDNNPFKEKHLIPIAGSENKIELYPARKDGNITSVAIKTFSNNGFGGKIEVMVGFLMDGSVNKFSILDNKETPGLGTKVAEPKFQNQFSGRNPQKKGFKVKQDGGDIDAVTAATISSRAVVDAIQKASDAYNKLSTGN